MTRQRHLLDQYARRADGGGVEDADPLTQYRPSRNVLDAPVGNRVERGPARTSYGKGSVQRLDPPEATGQHNVLGRMVSALNPFSAGYDIGHDILGPAIEDVSPGRLGLGAGALGLAVLPFGFGARNVVRNPAIRRGDLILHHSGPPDLPGRRPTGDVHYFGNRAFSDSEGRQFGPHRYVYALPNTLASRIVQLADDTPASRRIITDMVERSFPGERPGFLMGRSYQDELADFYEIFADRDLWRPYLSSRNIDLPGVAYHGEYLLPTGTIQRLRRLRDMPESNMR